MMMLVEFSGPAGVGKSFHARRLLSCLAARGVLCADFRSLSVRRVDGRSIVAMLRATKVAARLRPRSLWAWRRWTTEVYKHMARIYAATRRPAVYVSDESMVQRLREMRRGSRGLDMPTLADLLVPHAPVGRIVVVLTGSAKVIHARRIARRRPTDCLDLCSVESDVLMVEESIRTVKHLAKRHDIHLLVLDVDKLSESDIAERIFDCIVSRCADTTATRSRVESV